MSSSFMKLLQKMCNGACILRRSRNRRAEYGHTDLFRETKGAEKNSRGGLGCVEGYYRNLINAGTIASCWF
jgi:hypothetical protein